MKDTIHFFKLALSIAVAIFTFQLGLELIVVQASFQGWILTIVSSFVLAFSASVAGLLAVKKYDNFFFSAGTITIFFIIEFVIGLLSFGGVNVNSLGRYVSESLFGITISAIIIFTLSSMIIRGFPKSKK